MDVLWGNSGILRRMYGRGKVVVRVWLWQPGLSRAPRLVFRTPKCYAAVRPCGNISERQKESAEFKNMYSPRSPPTLIDTDRWNKHAHRARVPGPKALGASDNFCGKTRFLVGSLHCAAAFFLQVPKLCKDLDLTPLYILILRTHTKFVWKNNMASARRLPPADLLEHWQQVCRVKNHVYITTDNFFVSTTTNSMKCLVNWIILRIRVCLRNTQSHLNPVIGEYSTPKP